MKRMSGLKLLEEREGAGAPAKKGARIVYNARILLNQGEEVLSNELQAKDLPKDMVRVEGGMSFIDHRIVLGRRQAIAGIEQALVGMKVDGYKKVRISPHLAYRDVGIPGLIPPGAVLICEIWLRSIENQV